MCPCWTRCCGSTWTSSPWSSPTANWPSCRLCGEIAAHKELAVGLIDVKNYYIETPEDVAERIRKVLEYVPAEKLTIVPDCGFSQTARWATKAKLSAMVEGTRIVRAELGRDVDQ